jgi:hypothetical protein
MGNAITLSADQLVSRMDKMGVDMSVLLPLESPESFPEYFLTGEALQDWRRYPERLIPFGVIDPRHAVNKTQLLDKMVAAGIMGFGEHKNGLSIDDPRSVELFKLAGERDLPVLLHLDLNLCTDEDGQPRLESVLKECPNTVFLGHGPSWWGEISADYRRADKIGYPTGKITPGGSMERLMQEYPNMYSDLSAGSGFNAISRDTDFTHGFIERNWQKLMLGTDYLHPWQPQPQIEFLREFPMTDEQREAIMGGNAEKVILKDKHLHNQKKAVHTLLPPRL